MRHDASAVLAHAGVWTTPLWAWESLSPSPGPGAAGTAFSDYLENEVLDHLLSAATFTAAATLYYALFTSAPGDAGSGAEVSGGSYARQSVTNNATNFPVASGGSKSNGVLVNFGTATGNWGTVGYVALFDASSGGNMYFWGAMDPSIPILSGDALSFPVGGIVFSLD
jgi:hypothetical protein